MGTNATQAASQVWLDMSCEGFDHEGTLPPYFAGVDFK